MELTEVLGIGPKTAEKLMLAGKVDAESIAVSRVDEIVAILKIGRGKARVMVNDAKSKVLDIAMRPYTLKELQEYREERVQIIPTGVAELDDILCGGIETDSITGLAGAFASGKTQLCLTIAINCIKFLKRKVGWVESESGTLRHERIYEIAKNRRVKVDADKDFIIMPGMLVTDPNKQHLAYQVIERRIKEGADVGLIVIDSFSQRFREFYIGREMLTPRSGETARHMGYLSILASKYNLAVVFTTHVMGIPDAGKQLETKKKEITGSALWGGSYLKHTATTWLKLQQLKRSGGIKCRASIVDSSYLPPGDAEFMLGPKGVQSVKKTGGKA